MKRTMKKVLAFILAMTMVLGMGTVSLAKDKSTTTKESVKPVCQKVSKVTCAASGKVNISFKENVKYTDSLKVTITDSNGKELKCKIFKKNKAMMSVTVAGLVKGQKYTLTIDGILAKNATVPATITKTFTAKGMKTACKPSKVTVQKNFVTLKMNCAAYYKNATVTVTDSEGNSCNARIVKKAKGTIKVKIAGMQKGKTYTVTVNGVKTKKEKNYSSITKKFTVR